MIGAVAAWFLQFAVAQDQWWCNGDGLQTGLSCERNTNVADGRTYDDFDVPLRATVRGAWGNFMINFTPRQAYYEIRSGVSEGNGGTLHASGVMNVTALPTGRVIKGFTEHLVRGQFPLPVVLDAGRYWITVAPIGQGSGRSFVSDTDGNDRGPSEDPTPPPLGAPHNNWNSFFDSSSFPYKFAPVQKVLGWGYDFSFGVGPDTRPPVRMLPEGFEVTFGNHVSGTLEDLFYCCGSKVIIQQRLYPQLSAPNAQIVIDTTAPFDRAGYICLEFVSCVTASPQDAVIQRVSFFDYQSQSWVTVDEVPADTYECEYAYASATLDMDRFIEPQTRRVRAALSWFDRGAVSLDWLATVDFTQFVAEQR
jgi:hypothetical protein